MINTGSSYDGLQVCNEEIWRNVAEILSIGGKVNGLIGDYMSATLYATICSTPYQKSTNTGNNPAYPIGETQPARKGIKDNWEHIQFEIFSRKNCQHDIKKKIISAVFPKFLEKKKNN